jgi:hypothetical protein
VLTCTAPISIIAPAHFCLPYRFALIINTILKRKYHVFLYAPPSAMHGWYPYHVLPRIRIDMFTQRVADQNNLN